MEGAISVKNRKSALLLLLLLMIPLFISVRNVESKARASDLCVMGNYAYFLMTQDVGLFIMDISDENNPQSAGYLKLAAYSCNLIVAEGDYVYVSVQSEISSAEFEIYIIDVSDPNDPVQVGFYSYSTTHFANDLVISGGVLYIVVNYVLKIINVANPGSPVLLNNYSPWTIYGVRVVGTIAYVTIGDTGIHAIDVSNPSSPSDLGELTSVEGYDLEVEGTYAYLYSSNIFTRVNIANPANMTYSGNYSGYGYIDEFTVYNNQLFIIYGSSLNIVDFHTSSPIDRSLSNIGGYYHSMFVDNDRAYFSLYDLIIFDVSTPQAPNRISTTKIVLPGTLIRNIILGVLAIVVVSTSVGLIVWRRDQIKDRMERNRARRAASPQSYSGGMHKAVKISLIASIIFFVVSIAIIIGVQSWDFWTGFPICLSLGPISIAVLCLVPLITWIVVQARRRPIVAPTDTSTKRLTEVTQERQQEKQEGTVFCPSCGKEIDAGYKHCPECGYQM